MTSPISVSSVLLALSAMAIATSAVAATTTELKVGGTIKAAACEAAFSGNGTLDYGVIKAGSLVAGQNTRLPARQVALTVRCDAAVRMTMQVRDNRSASRIADVTGLTILRAPEDYNFGLGAVAGKNVGGYYLTLEPGTVADGVTVSNMWSVNGNRWHAGAGFLQHEGHLFTFGDSANQPVSFLQVDLKINVFTSLNKPENLPLAQEVPLDGSATIEFSYL